MVADDQPDGYGANTVESWPVAEPDHRLTLRRMAFAVNAGNRPRHRWGGRAQPPRRWAFRPYCEKTMSDEEAKRPARPRQRSRSRPTGPPPLRPPIKTETPPAEPRTLEAAATATVERRRLPDYYDLGVLLRRLLRRRPEYATVGAALALGITVGIVVIKVVG